MHVKSIVNIAILTLYVKFKELYHQNGSKCESSTILLECCNSNITCEVYVNPFQNCEVGVTPLPKWF